MMDKLLEDGDFEVVDECMEEDEATNSVDKNDGKSTEAQDQNDIQILQPENTNEKTPSTNEGQKTEEEAAKDDATDAAKNTKNEATGDASSNSPNVQSNSNNPESKKSQDMLDFAEDVSLESLKKKINSNVSDDDIVCLDEEATVLDSSFVIEGDSDVPDMNRISTDSDVILTESGEKDDGTDGIVIDKAYETKLALKLNLVKERLSKLARVLECSYPLYHNWLTKVNLSVGTSVCKLEPPRRCPLNEPFINRWKFVCSKARVQEETNKEGTAGATKNTQKVWQLTLNNLSESTNDCPAYVMRAVKVFEEFIQEMVLSMVEEITVDDDAVENNSSEADKQKPERVKKPEWLCLHVRSNRKGELMLFASGKNVCSFVMEKLRETFQSGPGQDCNVKSLYCKSITRLNSGIQSNTTFLVGSETLDEEVKGIKVQLAPKTNFCLNTYGAEVLVNAISDLLALSPKTTLVEIGCGIGLTGLTLASKCNKVIGLDSPSEVEEAEMMCEINNIKNASFVTGHTNEVMATIANVLTNTKATAIINANANIARTIDVMISLRKIPTLRRLVMVTTLTKQSVRSILELTRPASLTLGNPFIPIRAYVVDTLPYGSDFEIVILMERRMMQTLVAPVPSDLYNKSKTNAEKPAAVSTPIPATTETPEAEKVTDESSVKEGEKAKAASTKKLNKAEPSKKNTPVKPIPKSAARIRAAFKSTPPKRKFGISPFKKDANPFANKFGVNRSFSPNNQSPAWKVAQKFKPTWQQPQQQSPFNKFTGNSKERVEPFRKSNSRPKDAPVKRKREWVDESSIMRINPIAEKKMREEQQSTKEKPDLRERLSSNRIDAELMQKVKEQQRMLEMAQEKFEDESNIDVNTAKQIQNILSMVIAESNKLQSQIPLTVWDRIAPPTSKEAEKRNQYTPESSGSNAQKYGRGSSRQYQDNYQKKQVPRPVSPPRHRAASPPMKHHSPPRPVMAPKGMVSKRQESSYYGKQMSPNYRPGMSPPRQQMQQQQQQQVSQQQPRHVASSSNQMRRSYKSPPRSLRFSPSNNKQQQLQQGRFSSNSGPISCGPASMNLRQSPPRRPVSPRRLMDEWDIPTRGAVEQISGRPMERNWPQEREERRNEPSAATWKTKPLDERYRNSAGNDDSSWDIRGANPTMPWRTQQSGSSGDLWKNSQSGSQSSDLWNKPGPMPDLWNKTQSGPSNEFWNNKQRGPSNESWNKNSSGPSNESWNKPQQTGPSNELWKTTQLGQSKELWNMTQPGPSAELWNKPPPGPVKPPASVNEDHSRPDMRWIGSEIGMGRPMSDTWNIRDKDSFGLPDARQEQMKLTRTMEKSRWGIPKNVSQIGRNQQEKDEWNDLPEDARDPWADDNTNAQQKERWQSKSSDAMNFGPGFQRDKDSAQDNDLWRDSGNNWKKKNIPLGSKNLQRQQQSKSLNLGDARWKPMNDTGMPRFAPSGNQGSAPGNVSNWPSTFSTFTQQSKFGLGNLGNLGNLNNMNRR